MEHWRRRDRPPQPQIPGDLIQFVNFLSTPEYSHLKCYSQGHLSTVTLQDRNGDLLTVLYDLNFVNTIITTDLFMDATFKITPRQPKIYQIFTISALIGNNVSFNPNNRLVVGSFLNIETF